MCLAILLMKTIQLQFFSHVREYFEDFLMSHFL